MWRKFYKGARREARFLMTIGETPLGPRAIRGLRPEREQKMSLLSILISAQLSRKRNEREEHDLNRPK